MKTIVDADQFRLRLNLGEIVTYRDLLMSMAYRDLRVRYAQTFLGMFWAVLQPLIMVLIFMLVFQKVGKIETPAPYPLFALVGMAPWAYFAFLATQAGGGMLANRAMITKIYFPRLVIPFSKALVGFVDFFVALGVFVVLAAIYRYVPSPNLVFFPLFFVLTVLAGVATGVWLSALSVQYRDIQAILPMLVQFGLFVSPVGYPASQVPERFQALYSCNPMVGVLEGMRWSIFGGVFPTQPVIIAAVLIPVLLATGLFYFRRMERTLVDVI